jgi:hypothetical protein
MGAELRRGRGITPLNFANVGIRDMLHSNPIQRNRAPEKNGFQVISETIQRRNTMSTAKCLGIWMDHSMAHLMNYANDRIEARTIESKFTHEEKALSLGKSESLMHNKEQHEQSEYYKTLLAEIRNYDQVVLFGPTDAKSELANLLKDDHCFEKIAVAVRQADKMTANQMHAFVEEYFHKD